jgi:hypothetical protein
MLTRTQLAAHAVAIATVVGVVVLYLFPPQQYGFYPLCPVLQWTGLTCPGCGGTRALAELLHGHLFAALQFNALVVLLAPLAALWAVLAYSKVLQGQSWPSVKLPRLASSGALAAALVFSLWRNLAT